MAACDPIPFLSTSRDRPAPRKLNSDGSSLPIPLLQRNHSKFRYSLRDESFCKKPRAEKKQPPARFVERHSDQSRSKLSPPMSASFRPARRLEKGELLPNR